MSTNWQFRPNTQDEDIYNEVYVKNCYKLPDDLTGKVIVDIGANIGCFTIACLERGASRVIACEPDHENFKLLARHCNLYLSSGRLILVNRLIIGDSWEGKIDVKIPGYQMLNGTALTGGVSALGAESVQVATEPVVRTMPAKELIYRLKNVWLKLDCEGMEYQILSSDLPWDLIERVFGEAHDYLDRKFSRDTEAVNVQSDAFGTLTPDRVSLCQHLKTVGFDNIKIEYNTEDSRLALFFADRDEISLAMNDQKLRNRLEEDKKKEVDQLESGYISGIGFTISPSVLGWTPYGPTANSTPPEIGFDRKKSVVVLTPFRNARRYLQLYFQQIASLKVALEEEGYFLRLVAAEGDSLDRTRERIVELAAEYKIPLELIDTTHGHMHWGSVEDPVRMKVMSGVMNKALDAVKESDDVVVWIMSDLEWKALDIFNMIKVVDSKLSGHEIIAPMVFTEHQNNLLFYDTWAYRTIDGEKFSSEYPYCSGLVTEEGRSAQNLLQIGSAGTCLVMRGIVARKFRSSDQEAVSFCSAARHMGITIGLGSPWSVKHAPEPSYRLLWIGDAVCISGFSKVSHSMFPILSEAGYEIDIIATNFQGTPHNYPYRIWPADEGSSGALRMQQLLVHADKNDKQYDAIVVLDDPWNVPRVTRSLEDLRENHDIKDLPPVIAWVTVDGKNIQTNLLDSPDLYHVSCSTKFGADEILRAGGVNVACGCQSVIPFGVDTSIYHPLDKVESRRLVSSKDVPEDAFIVGTVSTNQLRKRLDLVLKHFSEWINRCRIDNVYLYLCLGVSNNTGCDILSLIRYYDLRKKVILNTSLVSEQAMAHVYNYFDVFISLSQGEGFGLCALEAMACGVPCVLSDWAGYSSWVPSDCAIKVPCTSTALSSPLNEQAYVIGGVASRRGTVDALHRLYTFPDMRERLSERGLSLAKQMSWRNTGDKLLSVVERVISQDKAGMFEAKSATG